MNPELFLRIAGFVLPILGILGLLNILQSISSLGFFHPPYWINFVHLTIGIAALSLSFRKNSKLQARVVLFPAVIGTTIGVLGLLFGPYAAVAYTIPELKDPSDHFAHLVVGITAIWAFRNRKK